MSDESEKMGPDVLTGIGLTLFVQAILFFMFIGWLIRTERSIHIRINRPGEEGTVIEAVHPRDQ